MGGTKGDTRSVDYGSVRVEGFCVLLIRILVT